MELLRYLIYFFLFLIIVSYCTNFDDKVKDNKNNKYNYILSREEVLSSDHRMFKEGYKFICYYNDTDPNAKIKVMDFYSKLRCPKSRNY
tara:strand:- start:279 stop:545 length:267 start_codon:yes stop_codon:yes gene_type:complete